MKAEKRRYMQLRQVSTQRISGLYAHWRVVTSLSHSCEPKDPVSGALSAHLCLAGLDDPQGTFDGMLALDGAVDMQVNYTVTQSTSDRRTERQTQEERGRDRETERQRDSETDTDTVTVRQTQ